VIGDDAIVFDGVAHVFNFDKKNALGPAGEMFQNHLYAFHATLTPEGEPVMPAEEFLRQWTVDDIREMVYGQSSTDLLCAMPLPLTDLFKDGLSPWEECAELASRRPDRTVFWGSVNPLEGRRALDLMERQVGEFGPRRSSSTTSATTTAGRSPGRWTTPRSPSRCSRRPRSWAST
jgi:hypothetical protein